MLLAVAGMARAEVACPPLPPPSATTADELLLLVDAGPGSEPVLASVMYGWGRGFWVDEPLLGAWRVASTAGSPHRYAGAPWHALADVPGLGFTLDTCAQALHVDLSQVERTVTSYQLTPDARAAVPLASPGAYLNYDVQLTQEHARHALAALTEFGVAGEHGRGVQTLLLGDRSTRLDSTWLWESPENLTTIVLGDAISYGGSWGRAQRFGGLRWATDFTLQPYFVTFPRPTLAGTAALPSTLDVFVNGTLGARQGVPGGAFELQDVPTLTGAGEAQIVVRDPLGRETRVTRPFYVSPELLRPGLRSFALDAGFERERYTQASADYGAFFADFTDRRGITDTWTQEVRVETASQARSAGTSALWLPRRLGVVSTTLAWGGRQGQGAGVLAALGFERNTAGSYSFGVRSQWADAAFWQLGLDGRAPPRRSDLAHVAVVPHAGASLALAVADEDRRDEADLKLVTLSYTAQLHPALQLLLSATDARSDTHDRTVLAAVSYRFGERLDAGAQYEWNDRFADIQRVTLQRAQRDALGWGYRAEADAGAFRRLAVDGQWGVPAAQLSADLVADESGASTRVGAAGGVVFLDRTGYFTQPVRGSYAVVKVADVPDVGVYADQRLVARTGAGGTALVSDLRPYQRNTLSIRAEDVPMDLPLDKMDQVVTPRTRRGVVVDFAGEARIGEEFDLRDVAGKPVPAGAVVRDIAMAERFPVGDAGRVYVRLPPGTHHLWVSATGWDCIAEVQVRRRDPSLPPEAATCKAQRR